MFEKAGTFRPAVSRAVMEYDPSIDERFVADRVMPRLPVVLKEGYLPIVGREAYLRVERTRMGKGSTYKRLDASVDGLPFSCQKDGLEAQITEEDLAFYEDIMDVRAAKSMLLKAALARSREERVASAIFNTSTWTGTALAADVSSSGPWTTISTDVITQINGWKEKVHKNCGLFPNALIAPTPNIDAMVANTGIAGKFPGNAGPITRQLILSSLAAIFGLSEIIEAGAIKNTAKNGQTHVGGYVWDQNYVMLARVIPVGAPPETPGLARTPVWNRVPGADTPFAVFTYDEEQTDSEVLKVREYTDELIIGAEFGFLAKVAART
ncbi:MAG TPA: hypothetical protein PLG73_10780 [Candidatus Sumerlaeota bacterium]|nr:hypothetical protein [Candidatus Sumerlaeota bacterium]